MCFIYTLNNIKNRANIKPTFGLSSRFGNYAAQCFIEFKYSYKRFSIELSQNIHLPKRINQNNL